MFYIILKGKVSVWLPMPHTAMKKPLMKFKQRVQQELAQLKRCRDGEAAELTGLKFRFKDLSSKRQEKEQ